MDETQAMSPDHQGIRIRYWAAAKAAAGIAEEHLATDSALTLDELRERVAALHPGTRLGNVLAACSALVDAQPASSAAPDAVWVPPGTTVDFLPPFAGG